MPASNLPSARAVVYARVSNAGQASIPDQLKWGHRLAREEGWFVVDAITDEGVKGDVLDRPGLAELEALFARNQRAGTPIERLLIWATDRLSRADALDAFAILATLRRSGLRWVHTPDRVIDLHSPLDRTLLSIEQDHKNNPFLKDHGRKALRGMSEVVQAGFWVGRIPLGYRLVKDPGMHGGKRRRSGRLAIDEETAPLVRELFERYSLGESTVSLAAWLTTKVAPPNAARWSAQTVRQLLMSETYCGVQTFGKRARGKHVRLQDGQAVDQAAGDGLDNAAGALVRPGAVPAIIDPDLFRRVQAMLASGKRRSHHRDQAPLPLSGIAYCGCCGGPIYAIWATVPGPGGKRTRRVICGNRARYGADACAEGSTGCPHDQVLAEVLKVLAENVLVDGALENLTTEAERQAGEERAKHRAEREALHEQRARLDAALARAQDELLDAPRDMIEDYQEATRRARRRRDEIDARLAEANDQPAPPVEIDPERFRHFWTLCKAAVGGKIEVEGGGLNAALKELVERVTIYWTRDARGRASYDRIKVELPAWLDSACNLGLHSMQALPGLIFYSRN